MTDGLSCARYFLGLLGIESRVYVAYGAGHDASRQQQYQARPCTRSQRWHRESGPGSTSESIRSERFGEIERNGIFQWTELRYNRINQWGA
jgi:hypothetical protein